MVQQKSGVPGGVYFFVSIEAKGKAAVFRDAFFKTKVERRWREVAANFAQLDAKEYVVNDRVVHAMVQIFPKAKDPEGLLDQLLQIFKDVVTEDWKGEGELWAQQPKIRRIKTEEELKNLRDFIVQKMLGGKELSRLEELDDELDDDNYYYN